MATTLPDLVRPFRGERFRATDGLSRLIAPPYDVITGTERARLAASDEHNIVHLMLPEAPGRQDRYAWAAAQLAAWRREGVLAQNPDPAVYVVAEDFALPSGARRTRLGMFAAVAAEPYETRRIRPHERTHTGPKADRLALLRATRTSLESIFVLAPDPDRSLAQALARVAAGRRAPDARAELGGVGIRLWVVGGEEANALSARAGRAQLYIADGHHRYETAVAYAAEAQGADRVLAFIVSVHDAGLSLLATHRIIYGAGRDPLKLLERWRRWFDVGRVAPCADRMERLAQLGAEHTACLVACPPGDYDLTLVLKPDAPLEEVPELGRSAAVRALDVARVEALVVREILAAGTTTPALTYTPDPREAFEAVQQGGASAAVLLNPTRVEQVFAVADAGDVMPPKSTYFYPKVPSGLVLKPAEKATE